MVVPSPLSAHSSEMNTSTSHQTLSPLGGGMHRSDGDRSDERSEVAPDALPVPDHSPSIETMCADARALPLADGVVDLVVTSPPYWGKRDYGVKGQLGQEETPREYVSAMMDCLTEWRRVLTDTGSVFLNIGDSNTWFR